MMDQGSAIVMGHDKAAGVCWKNVFTVVLAYSYGTGYSVVLTQVF